MYIPYSSGLPRPQNGKIPDSKKQPNGGLFSRFKAKTKNKCLLNSLNQDSEHDVTATSNPNYSTAPSSIDPYDQGNSTDSILSYQPVIQEENSLIRPVIILGVAKEEINKSLLKEYNDEFGICVPRKFFICLTMGTYICYGLVRQRRGNESFRNIIINIII